MATSYRSVSKGLRVLASPPTKCINVNPTIGYTSAGAIRPIRASRHQQWRAPPFFPPRSFHGIARPIGEISSTGARSGSAAPLSGISSHAASSSNAAYSAQSLAAAGLSMLTAAAALSIEPGAQDRSVMCGWGWGGEPPKKDDDDDDLKTMTQKLGEVFSARDTNGELERSVPTELSFGFAMGLCCGVAVKKAGTLAMVGVGLVFGTIQALSYCGFVSVEYDKMQKTFNEALEVFDFNADGKLDADDARTLYDKLFKAAAVGLPAGSGFATGAVLGFRRG